MRRHWTAAAALFIAMLICRTTVADEPAAVQIVLPTPVAQYVIEEVTARAAPENGAFQGTMQIKVRNLGDGETWVPLFDGKVGVLSAEVTGGGLFKAKPILMRRGAAVGLQLKGKGEFLLDVAFATSLTVGTQESSARLPMVPALSGSYQVSLPGRNLEVTISPDLPYQQKTTSTSTELTIYGTVEGGVSLRWKAGPEVREVETIAFAEQKMLLTVSPGLLRVQTEITYSLLQGRLAEAVVALPPGYSVLKVEGDNLRTWDLRPEADGATALAASLLDDKRAASHLSLTLEKTLEPVPVEIEAPQIVARGVTREKGIVAVAVEKGLQAEIVERENIGQVNLSEMPAQFRALQDRFSLGLRYLARPFSVKLRVSTIEPKVYGEIACLTVASLERLRQYWDVRYEIRNAGLFQLKLRLAPGMKLISLRGDNINNQSLDAQTNVLTVDLRSKAEGDYSLALQTSSEIADPENVALPALELIGAERQWGTVAVAADSGIAVEPGQMKGISQIDVTELQSLAVVQQIVREQKAPEPVLAFRYLSFPFTLALGVSRVQPELKVEPRHMVEITRKNLRYYSVFNYRIKKAGVFQLRMHLPAELRGSLQVKGPKVEDYTYDAPTSTLTIQLTEKTLGDLSIELETEALLGKELPKPGQSDTLAIPAIYTLDCEQERGHIALATKESIRLKRAGEGGSLHDVDVQEIPPALLQKAGNAKLAFRIIESPWDLQVEATSISPKIQAQTFNYIRFGEDYLIGASTIDFTIQYAGVCEFFIRLPEGVTEPNIRGDNIKIQEKVDETSPREGSAIEMVVPAGSDEAKPKGDLWRVELQGEVKNSYQLIFEYTLDLDPKAATRTFTGPRVLGEMESVEREIGYLAVTGDPSLELTPLVDKLKDLTPVDEEEIPLKFRQLPPSVANQIGRTTVPILFAFRYLAHPYELVLSSVRHDEADVVTAVIETCKLDTTLTREGNRITTLLAAVRSRYQPFLEIELPEGARLWHALVQGRRVRPLTETVGGAQVTKIPIAQVQGMDGPVQVELQWEELTTGELGKVETVSLRVPSLRGVRVLRLGWVLQMPRDTRVVSSSGTLDRVPGENYFEAALRDLRPTEAAQPVASRGRPATGMSGQMASNSAVLQGRGSGPRDDRANAVVAGIKPQLPQRYYFQGLILNPAVPAQATVVCITSSALTILLSGVVLVTFALCAVLWFRVGLGAPVAFAVLAATTLVVAGVTVIMEDNYMQFLLAVLFTVAGSAVLFTVFSGARAVTSRRAQPAPVEEGSDQDYVEPEQEI